MELSKKYEQFRNPQQKREEKFQGFPPEARGNFWMYPKIINGFWYQITGSEQKVLDYILRHTWGYQKDSDRISLRQFQKGIWSKKEKKWIDKGIGGELKTIQTAIQGLKDKGFIRIEKKQGKTTTFSLRTKE